MAERAAELVAERLDVAPATDSEFLTVAEAAELLRAKPQRIYDLLSSGRLERLKDGSRVLVRRADLRPDRRSPVSSEPVDALQLCGWSGIGR